MSGADLQGTVNKADCACLADKYGRWYAPLAVIAVLLTFLPLFEDVEASYDQFSMTVSYGTIFDMAGRPGGGPASLGLILLGIFVLLLVAASVNRRPVAEFPLVIAVVGGLIAVMLIVKPGTGTPAPALTDSGVAGLVLAIGTSLLAVLHTIHLMVVRIRS